MNILALDTSNEYCSLALLRDGHVAVREILAGQGHSELILAMLDEVLKQEGVKISEMNGIAYGSGPGSFTGLRIACGVAQGIAFGMDIPVVGIGTLHAMAQAMDGDRIVACLDARMGEIYFAAYERSGNRLVCIHEPGLYSPEDAPPLEGTGWVGCGSGFSAHGEKLVERYAGKMDRIDDAIRPHAREIALLAQGEFDAGSGMDAAYAFPLYVRNRVALKESER